MKREAERFLWFAAGFGLAGILSVSYAAVRFVPLAVAFGLLCFGCGVLLFLYLDLRRRDEELCRRSAESLATWKKAFEDLQERESRLREEKEEFEADEKEFTEKFLKWEGTGTDESTEKK